MYVELRDLLFFGLRNYLKLSLQLLSPQKKYFEV